MTGRQSSMAIPLGLGNAAKAINVLSLSLSPGGLLELLERDGANVHLWGLNGHSLGAFNELWGWNGHKTRSSSRAPEHDSRGEAIDIPAPA
jgi:hypothetical protein